MFNSEELELFLDQIKDKITEEVTLANRISKEEIYKVLGKYGINLKKENSNPYIDLRFAKILIVGHLNIKRKDVNGICKNLNIDPERLEFISYDEATNYDYELLRLSNKYSDVIFGATPHMGRGIGNSSSIITYLESDNEFPRIIRSCDSNGFNLNKTQLKESLQKTRIYNELILGV